MKILAIRGKNLASLEEEFVIDFTKEPLLSAGLFAIVGATGAGKSTILDTICLALYDQVPRFNTAESQTNENSLDKLSQKDTRNILHKGAIEGYAEVVFRAMNGNNYRAKWSVRRARGKSDGALQATSIELYNLSNNQDVQGRKTDVLLEIEKLVGLNYNQFTRAVMLAQGDFENFIKAKEKDKAELLEKLTGTDIYSEISKRIYEANANAKTDLTLLEKEKGNIEILSPEELITIETSREALGKELKNVNQNLALLAKQELWWENEISLSNKVKEAELEKTKLEKLITDAQPRIDYLKLIDESQEIRDTFLENKRLLSESEQKKQSLQEQTKIFDQNSTQINSIKQELDKCLVNKEQLEERYQVAKPQIDKAKALDIQIQNQKSLIKTSQEELAKLESQNKQILTRFEDLLKEQKSTKDELIVIHNWLDKNANWTTIIDNQQSTLLYLEKYDELNKLIRGETKMIDLALKALQDKENQLKVDNDEWKTLNEAQPSEIIVLRKSLKGGEACPVCGSKEHPYATAESPELGLKQEELEKRKGNLKNKIEQTQKIIEENKATLIRCNANKDSFTKDLKGHQDFLNKQLLQVISDWKNALDSGNCKEIKQQVEQQAKLWTQNQSSKEKCNNKLQTIEVQIKETEEKRNQCQEDIAEKNAKLETQNTKLQEVNTERLSIFEGQDIQEIEKKYEKRKQSLEELINKKRTQKEDADKIIASSGAIIQSLKTQLDKNKMLSEQLSRDIEQWIVAHRNISTELLTELTAKNTTWIVQERKEMDELSRQKTVIDNTLKERKIDWDKHQKNVNKPSDNKQKEQISSEIQQEENKRSSFNTQLLDIEIKIKNQVLNQDKIAKLEKDIEKKRFLSDEWSKLNQLFGSANGDKFKKIAQGYTLDMLLEYANVHLNNLNRRFTLQKIANSLVLQVVDNDMFGEVRPVHSLSGGESFLISLALALGLSSLSSNQMNIESLFIDEGFGSLDLDTLNIAMEALENLQMQGKKIGVISHVDSMKERINTQIQLLKTTSSGSSIINIVG